MVFAVRKTCLNFATTFIEERQAVVMMEIVIDHRRLIQSTRGEKGTFFDETTEHLRVKNASIEFQMG